MYLKISYKITDLLDQELLLVSKIPQHPLDGVPHTVRKNKFVKQFSVVCMCVHVCVHSWKHHALR